MYGSYTEHFSIINYRHSKSLKDKIIKKCNDDTEIIIHMSDFTGFEWDKCIVYGPSTQTKDICDAFDINYNTYLDLNYGIIFLNNNNVTYEEFSKSQIMILQIKFQNLLFIHIDKTKVRK